MSRSILPASVQAALTVPKLEQLQPRKLDDFIQQYSGQTAVRSVDDAQAMSAAANQRLAAATSQLRAAAWQLRIAKVRQFCAAWGFHPVLDGLIISSVVTIPIALVLALTGSSPLVLVAVLVIGFGVIGGGAAALLWDSGADDQDSRRERAQVKLVAGEDRYRAAHAARAAAEHERSRCAALAAGVAKAHHEHQRAVSGQAAIEELLRVDCRLLSGTQFEDYLATVFALHGYSVEQTGQSGDQGVDLVIARDGVRIAVQAKCYRGSVGNDAVQQAYTGRTYHQCARCAVVTNSRFTSAAIDVAQQVGCTLVDGERLRDLICGRLRL